MDIAALLAALQQSQRIGPPPMPLGAAMAAPEAMGLPQGPQATPALQLLAAAALNAGRGPVALPKAVPQGLHSAAGPVPSLAGALQAPEPMGVPAGPPRMPPALEILRRAAESAGPQVGPPAVPPPGQAGPPVDPLAMVRANPNLADPALAALGRPPAPPITAAPGDLFGGAGRPPAVPPGPMDMATREMLARALQGPYAEGGGLVPMPGALAGGLPLPSLEAFTKGLMGIPSDEPQKVEVTAAPAAKPTGTDALAALAAQFGPKPAGPTTMTVDPWTGKVETRMPQGWPGLPGGPGTGNIPVGSGIGAAPTAIGGDLTRSLIRKEESFADAAYMDTRALTGAPDKYRAGYGSDTYTMPDGTVKPVTKGTQVTREMAEADLTRRIGEFQTKAAGQVGQENWDKLNPNQVAALTSVTYNHGNLPPSVVAAVKSGDPTSIADSIEGLPSNPQRRAREAALARGDLGGLGQPQGSTPGGLPVAPTFQPAQLPTPPTVQALKTADPAAYDAYNSLKVVRPDPMGLGDRMANILATMAQGGQGTKNIGDFLLGAGGGAIAGAAGLAKQARSEDLAAAAKQQELDALKAGVGVQKAAAVAAAANAPIQAANQNAQNLFQRDVRQSELNAEAKNKTLELQHHINLAGWQEGKPQVMPGKDGEVHIVARDPNTQKVSFTTIPGTGENSMLSQLKKQADNIKSLLGDKGTHLLEPVLAHMAFGKGMQMTGTPEGGRMALLYEGINKAAESGVLQQAIQTAGGKTWQELDKEINAGMPIGTMGTPKGAEEYRKLLAQTVIGKVGQDPRWAKLVVDGVLKHAGHEAGPGVYLGLYRSLGGQ